jgi:tetratricopeptide (TPR) repeat protein
MYYWRMGPGCPAEYRQKTPEAQAALVKETEFAFKQAFTFCPYSPEAVYRYVNFLGQMAQAQEIAGNLPGALRYFDDAILVAQTCQKLDPYNGSITDLINTVKQWRDQASQHTEAVNSLEAMEETARTNPANVQNLVTVGNACLQMQQTNRAVQMFDQALARPEINLQEAQAVAMAYAQLQSYGKLESAVRKMVALAPNQPEPRCDLAALESLTGRASQALADLKIAMDLNAKRLAKDPTAPNLADTVANDPRFAAIRSSPDFQKLFGAH